MEIQRYKPSEEPLRAETPEALPDFLKAPQKVRESELALLATKKQPEAKLAHVTEAANRNEAVERLYELRHEVKGQAIPRSAVPVGQVVADSSSHQAALTAAASSDSTSSQPDATSQPTPLRTPTSRPSLYKRAINRGFIAALIVLILIEIILLILG